MDVLKASEMMSTHFIFDAIHLCSRVTSTAEILWPKNTNFLGLRRTVKLKIPN